MRHVMFRHMYRKYPLYWRKKKNERGFSRDTEILSAKYLMTWDTRETETWRDIYEYFASVQGWDLQVLARLAR